MILFRGSVEILEVARPNVKAEVRRAADVEYTIIQLIRAVGNGANASNAGSNAIRVVAADETTLSVSEAVVRKSSLAFTQFGGTNMSRSFKTYEPTRVLVDSAASIMTTETEKK